MGLRQTLRHIRLNITLTNLSQIKMFIFKTRPLLFSKWRGYDPYWIAKVKILFLTKKKVKVIFFGFVSLLVGGTLRQARARLKRGGEGLIGLRLKIFSTDFWIWTYNRKINFRPQFSLSDEFET